MAAEYATLARGEWNTEQIEKYLTLVRRIAGRMALALPSHVDEDDLIGYGVFGLLDAMERFDSGRGVKFETYATVRIRGAIIDGLRAMDWVPHSARQRVKLVQEGFSALENRLGRAVQPEEVAEHLAIEMKELEKILRQAQMLMLTSLDEIVTSEDGEITGSGIGRIPDQHSAEDFARVEIEERNQLLAGAIEKLPEKEQLILSLYYQEELTLKEIAAVMNLSESRISQLHSQALMRLRGKLGQQKVNLF
ncbi:MAG: FliA/WhiG family RNA polymerase sigma factor [Peptococcaceae bacterium]|jgi:RNA polymerase sigma factor for flagellar operon FliA|nr:FliA/WhiG family RNA polymerase sigma factor [Peptococcaceae bacterium]